MELPSSHLLRISPITACAFLFRILAVWWGLQIHSDLVQSGPKIILVSVHPSTDHWLSTVIYFLCYTRQDHAPTKWSMLYTSTIVIVPLSKIRRLTNHIKEFATAPWFFLVLPWMHVDKLYRAAKCLQGLNVLEILRDRQNLEKPSWMDGDIGAWVKCPLTSIFWSLPSLLPSFMEKQR